MSIQKSYNDWSETYDTAANRTRDLDEAATQETLGHRHFGSIVEIGCGTGKNTALLSKVGSRVHAIDFSEGMIQKAKEKLNSANVQFSAADITKRWPVPDQSADLVTCNLVLEHIEELTFVFAEAYRLLKKEGQLFVSELHPFRQYQGVQARFDAGGHTVHIDAFVHHISDFLSAASAAALRLEVLREWWHQEDDGKPPRLLTLLFDK
ncbi:MAG TPA: class I SAM-dependent methyltransferase [Bacteroidota bacterium]|jgi:malonyl-CoA O-methyltransferase